MKTPRYSADWAWVRMKSRLDWGLRFRDGNVPGLRFCHTTSSTDEAPIQRSYSLSIRKMHAKPQNRPSNLSVSCTYNKDNPYLLSPRGSVLRNPRMLWRRSTLPYWLVAVRQPVLQLNAYPLGSAKQLSWPVYHPLRGSFRNFHSFVFFHPKLRTFQVVALQPTPHAQIWHKSRMKRNWTRHEETMSMATVWREHENTMKVPWLRMKITWENHEKSMQKHGERLVKSM